jgi:hypothetical protein
MQCRRDNMYTLSVVFPSTKEGKELLEKEYASVLADITADRLKENELEALINELKKRK